MTECKNVSDLLQINRSNGGGFYLIDALPHYRTYVSYIGYSYLSYTFLQRQSLTEIDDIR